MFVICLKLQQWPIIKLPFLNQMYLRNIFLSLTKFSTQNSTKQVIETSKNLINPGPNDPIAFGYHFPQQWTQQKIYSLLDPSKKEIMGIKIVQNKLGQSAGKILFTFKNTQVMEKYIHRYNEDFVQTEDSVHRVILKRFELKNEVNKRQRAEYNKKYGVHLTNMDFDIDMAELQRLAEDFGQIQYIEMHSRQNGLNRGGARIYFKTRQASIDFTNFSDGLLYKERKLKCKVLKSENELKKTNEIKQIEAPKIFMKWNEDLYNRMVKKQVEAKSGQGPQSKVF